MNDISSGVPREIVSVFDNIQIFDQTMRMATALSRSAFVPKAFQGSPESCLVAIDLSRRLNVSPMTIFPHLYVIDNKPAFSTQFLITLVNRSGYFERLDWTTGTNGKVKAHFCDYKDGSRSQWEEEVPNHYAIAKLTERRTGKTFTSPTIDIAFAELNGWTSKAGSKWRTMPEIMCAYRSASVLIKRICPELTLGMNFAEDVEDSTETTIDVRQDVYLDGEVPKAIGRDEPTEAEFTAAINGSESVEELKSIGDAIASSGLNGESRRRLGIEYRRKQREIQESKTQARETGSEESDQELVSAVPESPESQESPIDRHEEQANESAEAKPDRTEPRRDPERPTVKQRRNYEMLVEALLKCKTRGEIKNLLMTAEGYVKTKIITEKLLTDFQHQADEKAEGFLV